MQKSERWFKKKTPCSTRLISMLGKFILFVEVLLYILSLKCILVNIIPTRVSIEYLDFPLTCILLMGYVLTFRSLYLAWMTESATVTTDKNYLTQKQHEQEKIKREEWEQDKQKQAEAAQQLQKQQEEEKKKQSKGICKRRVKKDQSNEQNEDNKTPATNENSTDKQCCIKNKQNSQQEQESTVQERKTTTKDKQKKDKSNGENKHKHGQDCKSGNCQEKSNVLKPSSCLKCNIMKEKHDHHCSMCNKCVYRLDHHCFFIGQCVGDYNYLYFISYVFLSYVMTMINLVALMPDVYDFISLEWNKLSISIIEVFILLLGGLLFHFFTMTMLIQHLYYISNEITYLENLHKIKKQEYSPVEWVFIILKCQAREKLYDTFTQRWRQIFGNTHFSSIIYPEGAKIKQE